MILGIILTILIYITLMERLPTTERHESMRGHFAYELYNHMTENEDIHVITADLGYAMFDKIRDDFPERFLNTGAAEQAAMGIAVGLAQEGKIPVIYSITNFLLYRPYETIRNYIDHEQVPVKLIAAGRDKDYSHDGYSHWSEDAKKVLDAFPNINKRFPDSKEDMVQTTTQVLYSGKPEFLSLRR